jgi:hypothetical protein
MTSSYNEHIQSDQHDAEPIGLRFLWLIGGVVLVADAQC